MGNNNKWTTKEPKENGWYWAYEALPELTADVFFVYVDVEFSKTCYGQFGSYDINDFWQWVGPIDLKKIPDPPIIKGDYQSALDKANDERIAAKSKES